MNWRNPKKFYLRTRVTDVQQGWNIICAIMRKGYEGVQNSSSRYNDVMFASAMETGYCWIGVGSIGLRIIKTHDKWGRKNYKDVSPCKFINEIGLDVQKRELPKSLKRI